MTQFRTEALSEEDVIAQTRQEGSPLRKVSPMIKACASRPDWAVRHIPAGYRTHCRHQQALEITFIFRRSDDENFADPASISTDSG